MSAVYITFHRYDADPKSYVVVEDGKTAPATDILAPLSVIIESPIVVADVNLTIVSSVPDTATDVPDVPEEPDVPEDPLVPAAPDVPEDPLVPAAPDVPEDPLVPAAPDVPEDPLVPAAPDVPEEPDVPEAPAAPDVPEDPDVPDDPEVPDVMSVTLQMVLALSINFVLLSVTTGTFVATIVEPVRCILGTCNVLVISS